MDRRLYISLFLTTLAVALGLSLVAPLLPIFAEDLGATGIEIGLIFSSFSLARSVLLPIVGQVADSWGRRTFLLGGLIVYLVASMLYVFADSVASLVICRLSQGVAGAMVVPVARSYVADMIPPGREGRLMGHFNMAFFSGLAIGPWLGGFLKDWYGMNAAFLTMAGLVFAGLVITWTNVPRVWTPSADSGAHEPMSYMDMLRHPSLMGLFVFRFGTIIGIGMNWSFMPLYGHDVLRLSASAVGLLISLNVVMTTLLQPLFGRLADRWDRSWMTFWGGLLASVCLLGLPYCHDFWSLFVVNLFLGVFVGMYMPPLMALSVDAARETGFMTRVMSLLELAFSVGMVVGPVLAGLIEETLDIGWVFRGGGLIGLATCVIFMVIQRRPNRNGPGLPWAENHA
ncbi:MAG: MFS transporter [Proteobacteria bacterium]|nr:MFS transporter [Pseudomonadota bacterium]